MYLSKQEKQTYIGYLVVFVLFTAMLFAFQTQKDFSFFLGLILAALSTVLLAAFLRLGYKWNSLLPGYAFGLTLPMISGIYMALSLTCAAFVVAAQGRYLIITIPLYALFTALFVYLAFTAAKRGRDMAGSKFEERDFSKAEYCAMLLQLADQYAPAGLRGRVLKVMHIAEKINPIIHWSLEEFDLQLQKNAGVLRQSLIEEDHDKALKVCDEIERLLKQRTEALKKLRYVL